MTTKLRWFKFYPGDWALDTQGMTPLAKGLYVDMLCMQWAGRRLPADLAELTIMLPAMTERTYRELLQHFVVEDGWLINRRLEREREDAEGRSENGRAAARRKHDAQCARSAPAVPPQCGGSAAAVPPQCHQDTDTDTEADEEEETEGDARSATRKTRAKQPDPLHWDGEAWQGITDKDRADWAVAFPDVDFDKDLAKAGLWLKAKKSRANKKNWRLFLFNWFGSTQSDGGNRGGKAEPNTAPRRPQRDRSHIPEDCAPSDEHLFWDGTFPNIPSMYTDTAGNLRSTTSRKIICAADT